MSLDDACIEMYRNIYIYIQQLGDGIRQTLEPGSKCREMPTIGQASPSILRIQVWLECSSRRFPVLARQFPLVASHTCMHRYMIYVYIFAIVRGMAQGKLEPGSKCNHWPSLPIRPEVSGALGMSPAEISEGALSDRPIVPTSSLCLPISMQSLCG